MPGTAGLLRNGPAGPVLQRSPRLACWSAARSSRMRVGSTSPSRRLQRHRLLHRLGQGRLPPAVHPHASSPTTSPSAGALGVFRRLRRVLTRWWGLLQHEDPSTTQSQRWSSWCSFREPGEDERWFSTIGALVPTAADAGADTEAEVTAAVQPDQVRPARSPIDGFSLGRRRDYRLPL